ncbi:ABC transporter ATP-binding protein C-terminal domain-containing protein [Yinghuangia aomiensis]
MGLIGTNGAGKSTLLGAIGGSSPRPGRWNCSATTSPGGRPPARGARPRTDVPGRHGCSPNSPCARRSSSRWRHAAGPGWSPRPRSCPARCAPSGAARRSRGPDRPGRARRLRGPGGGGARPAPGASSNSPTCSRSTPGCCLDEPTGRVAQRETEALGPLLLRCAARTRRGHGGDRARHAVPDVLHRPAVPPGSRRVIAEGTPEQVRTDPAVIAGYLGTDARAIDRSGVV